ncbi:MAG: hypothetical protein IJ874_06575 [Ruminococcus sp.]|nr:hypothetical protein [Ruminococcus sp.]
MTAATSQQNKSLFGTRFRTQTGENKKLFIINIILELLGLPVLAAIGCYYAYVEKYDIPSWDQPDLDGLSVVALICIMISLGLGILIALNSFRYLYQKALTDMHYSLPLNTRQRFFADYLSGLSIYLIPPVIAALVSLIILVISDMCIADLGEDFWSEVMPLFLRLAMIVVISLVMFYTTCVLAIIFTGNTFEAILSTVALNVMIPAVIFCTWINIASATYFGMSGDEIIYNLFMTSTDPIGNAIFAAITLNDYDQSNIFSSKLILRWVIYTVIFIALYILAAYLLYKHRKAEDVSKPYVYKLYYYVVVFAAVYCILTAFLASDTSLGAGILICAVGWFIMSVISRRGFRRIWVDAIAFAGAVALAMGINSLCNATDGFGAAKYVPADGLVSSVNISIYGMDVHMDMNVKDRAVIEEVTGLQQELIDLYFDPQNHPRKTAEYPDPKSSKYNSTYIENDYSTLTIKYIMRTGNIVMRSYSTDTSLMADLTRALISSDEYARDQSESLMLNAVNTNAPLWYHDIKDAREHAKGGTIELYDKFCLDSQIKTISMSDCERLREAYESDLKNVTPEELMSGRVYGMLDYSFWVLDSFENTIAFLDEIGFEKPDYEDILSGQYSARHTISIYPDVFIYSDYRSFDYDNYNHNHSVIEPEVITRLDPVYHSTGYYDVYNDEAENEPTLSLNTISVEEDTDLQELLEAASPVIIGEMPGAVVVINEQAYYILPEDKELAEKVYNEYFG